VLLNAPIYLIQIVSLRLT